MSATDIPTQVDRANRRVSFTEPLLIALVSRVGLFILAYLGQGLMHGPPKLEGNAIPGNLFLDGWTRWDGMWIGRIAEHGYTNLGVDGGEQRDVVQFPLYPLVVRGVSRVLGDVYLSGIVVSNVSFILAGILLFRLVERRWGAEVARPALVLLCVFPFSYTFSAMYTESLFILCTLAAFELAERKLWWPAAVCAGLAGATRVVGSAAAVALLVMYWRDREVRSHGARWRDLAALPLGFAGLAAYMIFLQVRFGDALAFVHAQTATGWGDFNSFDSLLASLKSFRDASFGNVASANVPLLHGLHMVMMVIAAVLCVIAFFKLPLSYSIFAALVVAVSYYRWACFGRHFATCFPVFIVAAILLRDAKLYHGVIYISALLLALLTMMFVSGYWVA